MYTYTPTQYCEAYLTSCLRLPTSNFQQSSYDHQGNCQFQDLRNTHPANNTVQRHAVSRVFLLAIAFSRMQHFPSLRDGAQCPCHNAPSILITQALRYSVQQSRRCRTQNRTSSKSVPYEKYTVFKNEPLQLTRVTDMYQWEMPT